LDIEFSEIRASTFIYSNFYFKSSDKMLCPNHFSHSAMNTKKKLHLSQVAAWEIKVTGRLSHVPVIGHPQRSSLHFR
jgi:hypothetical protein